jgi:hypothetical protein
MTKKKRNVQLYKFIIERKRGGLMRDRRKRREKNPKRNYEEC